MFVYPHFSRDQLFLLSLWLQSQDVTGLSVQRRFAYVVKTIVISADGAAGFAVLGCCFDFTVQNTANKLLSSAAARGPLNPVAFEGGWPEIDFCNHLGISFRILRPEQAILANYLIGGLWARGYLRLLHRLNDRLERHRPRGGGLLSDSDGAKQRSQRSTHDPLSRDAHLTCLAILGCGKHVLGQRKRLQAEQLCALRNASRCKLCGLGEDNLPTPNTVPDAPLDRRLIASGHSKPRTRIAVQPLSQSLCGRMLLPAALGLG